MVLVWIVLGLYLTMALVSYTPNDPGWTRVGPVTDVANLGGPSRCLVCGCVV